VTAVCSLWYATPMGMLSVPLLSVMPAPLTVHWAPMVPSLKSSVMLPMSAIYAAER
jgi:hypothetical protein